MGSLVYPTGRGDVIQFDDRTLAHLQFVIAAKLRLRQSFFFSWLDAADIGGGRGSIWLDSAIPLAFNYTTSVRTRINREWLELLMTSANSSVGLQLVAEPVEAPDAREKAAKIVLERAWSSADNLVRS